MSKAEITSANGQPRPFFLDSKVSLPPKASVHLMKATSESNAAILDDLRATVRNEAARLKRLSASDGLTAAQADVLAKLARTYHMIDSATSKEHEKYNYSTLSEAELTRLAEGKK